MNQLEKILAADQRDKEAQAKKSLQEMELYKRQLKENMKEKIKKTKKMLKDLDGKEADASSRLTLLQNQQLVAELEYQSRQAEKLLAKNIKLEEQAIELKREIEIHKQVEAELARQSQTYQKQARNYNNMLKTYTHNPSTEKKLPTEVKKVKPKTENDELIMFLEDKLDEAEKKFTAFQHDYDALHENYMKQQKILEKMRDKYSKAANLLTEFLDNMINSTPNLLQDEKNLYLDVERLYYHLLDNRKNVDFDELKKEEKAALIIILLKQLQPYLSDINLSVAKENDNVQKFLGKVNVQQQNSSEAYNTKKQNTGQNEDMLPCLFK